MTMEMVRESKTYVDAIVNGKTRLYGPCTADKSVMQIYGNVHIPTEMSWEQLLELQLMLEWYNNNNIY